MILPVEATTPLVDAPLDIGSEHGVCDAWRDGCHYDHSTGHVSRKDIWESRLNVPVLCSQRPSVLVGKLRLLLLLLLVICVALHVTFTLLTTLQHPDVLHLPC